MGKVGAKEAGEYSKQLLGFNFINLIISLFVFTHFNIQYTDHVSGKKYIILKIDEPGYFDGQIFRPPIFLPIGSYFAHIFYTLNKKKWSNDNCINNIT